VSIYLFPLLSLQISGASYAHHSTLHTRADTHTHTHFSFLKRRIYIHPCWVLYSSVEKKTHFILMMFCSGDFINWSSARNSTTTKKKKKRYEVISSYIRKKGSSAGTKIFQRKQSVTAPIFLFIFMAWLAHLFLSRQLKFFYFLLTAFYSSESLSFLSQKMRVWKDAVWIFLFYFYGSSSSFIHAHKR